MIELTSSYNNSAVIPVSNKNWKSAGTTLAEEFKKAIRDRGIPVNAKR